MRKSDNQECVISFAGASGSGKTTVVEWFRGNFPTYIEDISDNPYLADLLAGRADFNAGANQRWFLERISKAVDNADRNKCLMIDQDPAAVVDVYSTMFYDEGRIEESEMETIRRDLGRIEERISQWGGGSFVLFLDASAEVLFQRALSRARGTAVPEISWFQEVRRRFLEAYQKTSSVEHLDTTTLTISEVRDAAVDFVNRKLRTSGKA